MLFLYVLLGAALFGSMLGWFVIGPVINGFKPFTTPMQAARGERRLRGRRG